MFCSTLLSKPLMNQHFLFSPKKIILFGNAFLCLVGIAISQGATSGVSEGVRESQQLILRAAQAVDHAWEEFHESAIGGTLASPRIQTKIEGQLHQARALLMDARQAARRGDHQLVKKITEKVLILSNEIVQASRERKQ